MWRRLFTNSILFDPRDGYYRNVMWQISSKFAFQPNANRFQQFFQRRLTNKFAIRSHHGPTLRLRMSLSYRVIHRSLQRFKTAKVSFSLTQGNRSFC